MDEDYSSERDSLLESHRQDAKIISSSSQEENDEFYVNNNKKSKLSKRQWLTVVVFGMANLGSAVCISLQAPFYPLEAEEKGATPTQYGFVFGIYELICFLTSPLFGKYLPHLGPRFVYNAGIFLTAGSCILFGTLEFVKGHVPFLALSFAIRIVEALGSAGTLTATFAIIAMEFPHSVATTFASLETFFGLGLIAGPAIGGILYQYGGFLLPFLVTGSLLLGAGVVSLLLLPGEDEEDADELVASTLANANSGLLAMLRVPDVLMSAISITCSAISIGFLSATLEPHLREFGLTPVLMGLMFIVSGGMYAIAAPLVGYLCDRGVRPKLLSGVGNIFVAVSYLLMGPAPFIPIDTILWLVIVGLAIHGTGIGFIIVSSFVDALRSATINGFANDISTYAVVSGLWASSFALGAFLGPSFGGILLDYVGFRKGSLANVGLHSLALIAQICFIQADLVRSRPRYTQISNSSLDPAQLRSRSPKPGPSSSSW